MPDAVPPSGPARLDAHLSALDDGPVPPLAAASVVRARGDQRRRRTRAVLATAVAVLVASLAGTVALQGGGGRSDALRVADPVTTPEPNPSVCYDASYESLPEGSSVGAGSCPSPKPTPPPENLIPEGEQPPPPSPALLTPEQASRAEQPGWTVDDPPAGPGPLFDPCADGTVPFVNATRFGAFRAMASEREAGGSRLVQSVVGFYDDRDAAAAFEEHAAAVVRCPETAVEGAEGYTTRFTVVSRSAEQGGQRMLVQVQPCAPQNACTAHFRSYLFVAQTGNSLTTASYGILEDGDPEQDARALLDAAAQALAVAVESGWPDS